MIYVVAILIGLLAGVAVAAVIYFTRIRPASEEIVSARKEMASREEKLLKELEAEKKVILLEAKEESFRLRAEIEQENKEKRAEIQRLERKLTQKEETLDRRADNLDQKEKSIGRIESNAQTRLQEANKLLESHRTELERVARMSTDEARQYLLSQLDRELVKHTAKMVRQAEENAKEEADRLARNTITLAIQRCAVDQVTETTVSVVPLPGDDMKGRIIGREGRNIRTFESLTGVEVMIDDTPGAIIISAFDPVRREVAKLAMEKLVADGRIHPARIEEIVGRTRDEMNAIIKSTGEAVVLELGIVGLHPELSKLLGRLKYRTSYGQNVLVHSKEVAYLASLMAQELDLDPALAKRAGLLHDIGKAADQSIEGPHASIGAELARRFGEEELVANAIAAHHEEATLDSPYAFLVAAADSVSGSRPGARRESFETYVKRVEALETIASSMDGVERAYAIQAGREIRVLVEPDKVTDRDSAELAAKVAAQIQGELKYPGQIKVTVIRETRAVDYAH